MPDILQGSDRSMKARYPKKLEQLLPCMNRILQGPSRRNESAWTELISQHAKCGQGRQALTMYEEMRKEGVEPSQRTFVTLFKACTTLQDVESAKRIHAELLKSRFKSDLYLSSMLVDVYAKCRSLGDARHAFEKLPRRNVVSWTAMILGYAQMGKGEEALQLYSRMQQEGVLPNDRTYVGALKACSSMSESGESLEKCLQTVRSIHAQVLKGKFESDVFVGNMLVDVYAKCGSLEDARWVFENMPCRDLVSWNAMISGCAQMDKCAEALQLYDRMQQEGLVPNDRTCLSALKACGKMAESGGRNKGEGMSVKKRCLEIVSAIHKHVLTGKFDSGEFVGTALLDTYAKCGGLEDARRVFEKMPRRDVVAWTAMILGYVQMDMGDEALQLYTRMQNEGVLPDERTYVCALKACSSLAALNDRNGDDGMLVKRQCLETVREIHANVRKGKFESEPFVGNMLVDVYAKCGSLKDARCVFEKMPNRTVVSWNAIIQGYAQMDKGEEALHLYTRMQQEGVVPDNRTYLSALKACSTLAELNEAERIYVNKKCLETVRSIHADIVKRNVELDVFLATMLVDMYARCGSLDKARHVFEKMPHRDVVSWTAMILGYTQMDKSGEALQLYTRMQEEGVAPNEQTYVGALNACGNVTGLEKGKEIHAQILKAGVEASESSVTASLINMYGKCGSLGDARQVFDALPTREILAWNSLIAGYAHHGESELVFELFYRMKREGLRPDDVTFLGILTVCSHAGLVDWGQMYFASMNRDYGITPTIKHFTCMVDLLSRSGQLEKAMDIVKAMPFQPDSAVWACVLGGCQKWGDVELGRQAFECAVRLNEDDSALYVLMSNIYAAAHMWEEAKEMQAMRKKSRAWKQPGWSRWTDTNGIAHVFVVGDRGYAEIQEMYAKLGDLLVSMKKVDLVKVIPAFKNRSDL